MKNKIKSHVDNLRELQEQNTQELFIKGLYYLQDLELSNKQLCKKSCNQAIMDKKHLLRKGVNWLKLTIIENKKKEDMKRLLRILINQFKIILSTWKYTTTKIIKYFIYIFKGDAFSTIFSHSSVFFIIFLDDLAETLLRSNQSII